MVTRKAVVVTPQPGLLPDQYPGTDVLPGDDAIAIQDFVTEQGGVGDAKVFLYRIREDGKEAYLKEYVPTEFSWEDVQQNFGGGTFRIRGYAYDEEKGKRTLFINRRQLIETPGNKPTAPATLAPLYREASSDTALMLKGLSDALVKLGELIVQARPVATTENEMLDRMLRYKELFSGNPVQREHDLPLPMEQTMGALREMMGFVKENMGGNGEPKGDGEILMNAIDKFAPAIVELIKKSQEKPVAALPAPITLANAGRMPINPVNAAQLEPSSEAINDEIRQNVIALVGAASKDVDPTPYAALAVERMPQAEIEKLLNDPQWKNKLAVFDNRVLQFTEWFDEFKDACFEMLTAPPEPDDTAGIQSAGEVNVFKPAGKTS